MEVTFYGASDPSLFVADRSPVVATACLPACLLSFNPRSLAAPLLAHATLSVRRPAAARIRVE